ncbi:MAG: hypothetical protein KBD53_07520 [Candidatus Omnitrophica bacterium]|nr:hypothetical protein [Candidatus Omnitrophota bacterium]
MKKLGTYNPLYTVSMIFLLLFMGIVSISPRAEGEEPSDSLTEEIKNKDLIIDYLRRTIIYLETQLTNRPNKDQLSETNHRLEKELMDQKEESDESDKKLKKKIDLLQKEKKIIATARNSSCKNANEEYEKRSKQKAEELQKFNDLVSSKDKDIEVLNQRIKELESASALPTPTVKNIDEARPNELAECLQKSEELEIIEQKIRIQEEKIAALSEENQSIKTQYNDEVSEYKKQINEKDLALKLKEDDAAQNLVKLNAEIEKNASYQELLDKQTSEIAGLNQNIADLNSQITKSAEEASPPVESNVEQPVDPIAFNQRLEEERAIAVKEIKENFDRVSNESAALKIQIADMQSHLDKTVAEKSTLEAQLQILTETNAQLTKTVEELNLYKSQNIASLAGNSNLKDENTELNERMEILLQENASYQEKVVEAQARLQEAADATKLADELNASKRLIQGYKKDANAKTLEISSLSDENRDLRLKLKESLNEIQRMKVQVKELDENAKRTINSIEHDKLQKQTDILKTDLSNARQLIAQKDVALEELQKDRDSLKNDIVLLTEQLNSKIQQLGEIDAAKRTKKKMYSEKELETSKAPLEAEIVTLKNRISELENQLVDTLDKTENMLLELKNVRRPKTKASGGH